MKNIWSKEAISAMTNDVKNSTHKETIPPGGRPLTGGEIEMLKKLFGNAIDYNYVRIHKDKFTPGIQDDNVSMTPWGELYMPPNNYSPDFTKELSLKKYNYIHHFIHEMAHVWQYHRKDFVFLRGTVLSCGTGIAQAVNTLKDYTPAPFKPAVEYIETEVDPYVYKHDTPSKDFFSYSLESQAEILADYYMQEILGIRDYYGKELNSRKRYVFFYKKTLENFLIEVDDSNRRPRDLKKEWNLQ